MSARARKCENAVLYRPLLVVAAALAALPVRAAEPPLARVDRLLAAVERGCEGAERRLEAEPSFSSTAIPSPTDADWARAGEECRRTFKFEGMLASYGKTWTEAEFSRDWNEFVFAVVMNQVCVGLATGVPDACADPSRLWDVKDREKGRPGMGPVSPDRTLRELCREEQNEPRAMRAYARGAKGFLDACLGGVLSKIPVEKRPAVCPAVAERLGDPKLAAAAAVASMESADRSEEAHIAHDISVAQGLIAPKDCPSPDPFKSEMCVTSYVAARARRGERADCGDSAFCRAMNGGGAAACEPYALRARAVFCARDFRDLKEGAKRGERARARLDKESARREKVRASVAAKVIELRASLDSAGRLLDAVPSEAPGASERRAKAAALQKRLDALQKPGR